MLFTADACWVPRVPNQLPCSTPAATIADLVPFSCPWISWSLARRCNVFLISLNGELFHESPFEMFLYVCLGGIGRYCHTFRLILSIETSKSRSHHYMSTVSLRHIAELGLFTDVDSSSLECSSPSLSSKAGPSCVTKSKASSSITMLQRPVSTVST